MALSIKENYLEAINYGSPEYVPMACEELWHSIRLDGAGIYYNTTDSFGVFWESAADGTVPFPKGNPLKDLKRQLSDYKFPSPDSLVMNPDTLDYIKTIDRSKYLINGDMIYFCFERVWALMGMETFFSALFEFPDEVRYVLHEIAKYARGIFDRYLELGVDSISFSEDLGSQRALMISPKHFREFFIPEYKYAFENVLKEGKIINFHSCGCVDEIVRDLAEIGVKILNPIQARANDLYKIKSDVSDKMALCGGIDTHMILTGSPDEVKAEVIRVMEILKPGGGYICSTDQYFPNMPEENIYTLWKTAKEVGRY